MDTHKVSVGYVQNFDQKRLKSSVMKEYVNAKQLYGYQIKPQTTQNC